MSIKIKQTTRKFYNKWNYKISFRLKNARVISTRTFEFIESHYNCDDVLLLLAKDLHNFDHSTYAKRIESNVLDLYTNDDKFFDFFLEKYKDIIRLTSAPLSNCVIENSYSIIAKKLPHDRYRYKVFLQPHKVTSKEEKIKYLDWLDTQKPKINLTDTVKDWFYKTHWNWDRRYMYVEDEQMLLMLKLKKPEALGTIYTFVISDK
jgi:hypothetical protein